MNLTCNNNNNNNDNNNNSNNNNNNNDKNNNIYMLLAALEVRIGKNCDRGLENAARGRRPRAAFSSPRSQFLTIRTDPKPDNNMFILFSCGELASK